MAKHKRGLSFRQITTVGFTSTCTYAVEFDGRSRVAFAFDGTVFTATDGAIFLPVLHVMILSTQLGGEGEFI